MPVQKPDAAAYTEIVDALVLLGETAIGDVFQIGGRI
jgi:hypothetical protein